MEAHRADSRAMFARGQSADAHEGVTSFLEKRPADFTDRVSDGLPDIFPAGLEPRATGADGRRRESPPRGAGLTLPAPMAAPPGVVLPFELVRVSATPGLYLRARAVGRRARPRDGKGGSRGLPRAAYEAARRTGLSILASLEQSLGDLDRVPAG